MIYINRNSINNICLTLTETATITNPYFIFSFQHYATLDALETLIYFTTPNISQYTERYDLFLLHETDTGSSVGGNNIPLYLKPGQYEYKAYQSVTASLNPADFGTLLETGRMVVGDMTQPEQDTAVADIYR